MINQENFPSSETAKEMMESVTKGWYDRSYVGKWLYQVMGLSMEQAKRIYEELPAQFFVGTATWGLAYHEQKYGLSIRENLSYEERRRLILQRMASRVPMTPYNMELLLKQLLQLEAEISDICDSGSLGYQPDHPNRFKVVIWERGTNEGMDFGAVEDVLHQVKQSHTVFASEHRQILQRSSTIYVGALHTDYISYDIKPRPVNRAVDSVAKVGVAAAKDLMIFEEIGRRASDGGKQ